VFACAPLPVRHSGQSRHRTALALLFLLGATLAAPAETILEKAEARVKTGDREGAARLYGSWLEANPGASSSASVFSRYFSLEEDFLTLVDASEKFLSSGRGVPGSAPQFALIARLLELSGKRDIARDAYLAAYEEGAGDAALVSALLLSLQMDDREALAKSLPQLKGRGAAVGTLLASLAALQAGNDPVAQENILSLAEAAGDPDLLLKSLWVLYAGAMSRGDDTSAAELRTRIQERFPGSPESVIAARATAAVRSVVTLAPSPSAFTRPEPPGPAAAPPYPETQPAAPVSAAPLSPAPALPAPVSPVATIAVQAGSFQMKENAEDLVAELTRRGFSPVVRQESIQGRDHFRVFAATGLDSEQARSMIARLKQLGFSGFAVTEKTGP
jgi:cell division septation protein DedD